MAIKREFILMMIVLIQIFLTSDVKSQTNWYWSRPLPTGSKLNSVYFIDCKNGFAGGSGGTIIKTIDGGINWTLHKLKSHNDISGICFINKTAGFAVGKSGMIMKTSDGGNTWINISTEVNKDFNDIFFVNKNIGYIAGLSGTILKTTNGGENWHRQMKGSFSFFSINFFNENIGAAGGYNVIFHTTNGGKSWIESEINNFHSGSIVEIYYADEKTIYAVSDTPGGEFLKSVDGGINWEKISLDLPYLFEGSVDLVRSMSFSDINRGFIVTDFGTILKTINGGKSWDKDSTFRPASEKLTVMCDVNISESECVNICGAGGTVFTSTNNGMNWFVSAGNEKTLKGNSITDLNTVYCVGETGTILKSQNGGSNWNFLKPFTNKFLNSVYFINCNTGFAAGNSGTIFKTTNGGESWINQTGYTNLNENSICFLNNDTGIVAGGTPDNERAFIFRTTNGGTNWYEVYDSMSMGVFNSITFTNRSTGFITGDNGNVLKTENAGWDWTSENLTTINLNSVSFADSLNGLICGDDGIIFKTSNGGDNWHYVYGNTYKNLSSIKYFNQNFVTAVGEEGIVVKSTDGGLNWLNEPNFTSNNLLSVNFINEKIFAFGEYGTIIYSGKVNNNISVRNKGEQIKFSLNQNFPNPFNPKTKLGFEISDLGFISLRIYDVTGKEIVSLLNERKIPGYYEVVFDGSNFPSGVYFYRIEFQSDKLVSGELIDTKRMVLLK